MKKSVIIRTYYKDIVWLKYCLESIKKNLYNFDELIIIYPENQIQYFEDLNFECDRFSHRFVTCPVYSNDYLGQQISKLRAFEYTDSDLIMFIDSDCIINRELDFDDFLENGMPIIYRDKWEDLPSYAHVWKDATERIFNYELKMEYEYMRKFPFVYWRDSLMNVYNKYTKHISLDVFILSSTSFSEFNMLGLLMDKYENDKYVFKVGKYDYTYNISQFWSKVFDDEIELKIKSLLKLPIN